MNGLFGERLQFDGASRDSGKMFLPFARSWFLKTKKNWNQFLKCGYDVIHVCAKWKAQLAIKDFILFIRLHVCWYQEVTATTRRRGHPLLSHRGRAACRPQQDQVLMKGSSTGLCHLFAAAVRFILFQNLFLVKSRKKRREKRGAAQANGVLMWF